MSPDFLIGWALGVLGCCLCAIDWSRVSRLIHFALRPLWRPSPAERRHRLSMARASWAMTHYWSEHFRRLQRIRDESRANRDADEARRRRMRGGLDLIGLN